MANSRRKASLLREGAQNGSTSSITTASGASVVSSAARAPAEPASDAVCASLLLTVAGHANGSVCAYVSRAGDASLEVN